ncbi:MAG: hypothetical protein WAW79_06075 [Steroidobacteraceae bacterium]
MPGILFAIALQAAAADAELVNRDAIFTRAQDVAAVALPDAERGDLALFYIAYDLTLLETGNPVGSFEVVLLLKSSREVLKAREVIAAAPDAEAAARLAELLDGAELAYHYRTIRVNFPELENEPASASYSALLLNRDPDSGSLVAPLSLTTDSRQAVRSTP